VHAERLKFRSGFRHDLARGAIFSLQREKFAAHGQVQGTVAQ
jgi:hypothetical protein